MADAGGPDALALMMGPAVEAGPDTSGEDAYMEAFSSAASAAMQAWESGDTQGFAVNLKDAIEICLESKSGDEIEEVALEGMI